MDITLTYEVNEVGKETNFSGIRVDPIFNSEQVRLTFPQIETNYDELYDDMNNTPTEVEVKFTSMGAERVYSSLRMESVDYQKKIGASFAQVCRITITLQRVV